MYNENKNTAEYGYLHEVESACFFSDLHSADWWVHHDWAPTCTCYTNNNCGKTGAAHWPTHLPDCNSTCAPFHFNVAWWVLLHLYPVNDAIVMSPTETSLLLYSVFVIFYQAECRECRKAGIQVISRVALLHHRSTLKWLSPIPER